MTVRNVRAHQSRGLLPPPEVRGRTGFYGAEHVARLELIRTLQDDGFNLESIRRLLERTGGSSEELLRFTRAAREPFADETPEVVELEELGAASAPTGRAGPARARGRRSACCARSAKGASRTPARGWRAPAPSWPRSASARRSTLDVVEELRGHADAIAEAFVELFLAHVWRPFDAAGRPPERWPEVRETLERLRPLAGDAVMAVFGLAMSDAVERAFGEVLEGDAGAGSSG